MDDSEKRAIQEFSELQEKVMVQAEMASKIQQQERVFAMQRQHAVLTKQELEGMPDNTVMYKSIGRAYFCSPKAVMVKELADRATAAEADVKRLGDQREALEKKMGDTEKEIRELLKQSPSLARRLGELRI